MQRVSIAGCGRMGRERARTARVAGATIAAVFDSDVERAHALVEDFGGHVAPDPDSLLEDSPDALFLCTPPNSRETFERVALEACVPFFAEKPVGTDAGAPSRTLKQLEATSIVTAVGYMNRHRRGLRHGKALLKERRLLGLVLHWFCGRYQVPWWDRPESSGGPINEQATHWVDLCRFLAGEPDEVKAVGHGEPPTCAAISMGFAGGCHATVLYSCEAPEKHIGVTAVSDAGHLVFSGWDVLLVENTIDGFVDAASISEDIFQIETSDFLRAVREKDCEGVASSYADAVQTQRLVDRIKAEIAKEGSRTEA